MSGKVGTLYSQSSGKEADRSFDPLTRHHLGTCDRERGMDETHKLLTSERSGVAKVMSALGALARSSHIDPS